MTAKRKAILQTKTGWVNVHIDLLAKKLAISSYPYDSKEDAEKGIYMGYGIHKIGCFQIEYPEVVETFKN